VEVFCIVYFTTFGCDQQEQKAGLEMESEKLRRLFVEEGVDRSVDINKKAARGGGFEVLLNDWWS
jgi:hypothetical protein